MVESFGQFDFLGNEATLAQDQRGIRLGDGQAIELMPQLIAAVSSIGPEAIFAATQTFRKLLSVEQGQPIDQVTQAGIVPRFVQLLREVSQPTLQFEAARVLTNIRAGTADQTR